LNFLSKIWLLFIFQNLSKIFSQFSGAREAKESHHGGLKWSVIVRAIICDHQLFIAVNLLRNKC
jgi:hypothetical protein